MLSAAPPGPARLPLLPLLALLLAGCAQPDAGIVTIPLGQGASPACPPDACSWEWWNLTLEGDGWRRVDAPLPVVAPWRDAATGRDPSLWARNLTVEGDGSAALSGAPGRFLASVEGQGPLRAHARLARPAGPTGFAEDFLRARWGPEAGQTRPASLDVAVAGKLEGARLVYEARGGLCERRAVFVLDAPAADGIARLRGADEVTCR